MFFIIGAPKSGTTALWQYLRSHPQIRMPIDKEAPYFASRLMQKKGWDWYMSEYFSDITEDIELGSASPQYMSFPKSSEDIAKSFPDAKIIAVLRDPIERAASHYKMMKKRGIETRSFDEAIKDQLSPGHQERYRSYNYDAVKDSDETNTYVAHSEYKRILSFYFELFPRNQILLINDTDLLNDRVNTFKKVLTFIGVDNEYLPSNLQSNFHVGGTRRKRDHIIDYFIKLAPLKIIAKALLPKSLQKAIAFKLTTRNQIPEDLEICEKTKQSLKTHFAPDMEWLRSEGLDTTRWVKTS